MHSARYAASGASRGPSRCRSRSLSAPRASRATWWKPTEPRHSMRSRSPCCWRSRRSRCRAAAPSPGRWRSSSRTKSGSSSMMSSSRSLAAPTAAATTSSRTRSATRGSILSGPSLSSKLVTTARTAGRSRPPAFVIPAIRASESSATLVKPSALCDTTVQPRAAASLATTRAIDVLPIRRSPVITTPTDSSDLKISAIACSRPTTSSGAIGPPVLSGMGRTVGMCPRIHHELVVQQACGAYGSRLGARSTCFRASRASGRRTASGVLRTRR